MKEVEKMSKVESRWFDGWITGKTTEQRGLIFKRTVYIIAFSIPDAVPSTTQAEVEFHQYVAAEVGKRIQVKLYRTKDGRWAASKELAEYINDIA